MRMIGYRILGFFAKFVPRTWIWRMRYFKRYHRLMHLRNPRDVYEKMVQISLKDDPNWIILADKLKVRDFITSEIGAEYLNELYGFYERAEDIDFSKFPSSFVLKTNNGSATNIIVEEKSAIDEDSVRSQLNTWLKIPYGEITGQKHYSKISPYIIAEKYLEEAKNPGGLVDYKFFCVNGRPINVMVCYNREKNSHKFSLMFFDMDWNPMPEYVSEPGMPTDIPCPQSFNEMKLLAAKLSTQFEFVRVDFYEIKGKPMFGEMTFLPGLDYLTSIFHNEMMPEFGRVY